VVDPNSPPLIDERVAVAAARAVIIGRRDDAAAAARLRAEVTADLPAIDAAARRWTELGADLPPTEVRVVGRLGWVRANLAGLRGAFEPLRDKLGSRRAVTSRVLGAQLGGLFGLLSTRVLGQFVLPLGSRVAGGATGELVVVGPNVLDLAADRGELATDVRRTVMLHEVTHRLQFDGSPWLGAHLQGLLDRYLEAARVTGAAVQELAGELPGAIASSLASGSPQPLIELVLTPDQMTVMDEAQGLMSLLEGHGNAAMYGATEGLIDDPEGVREHLASRRGDLTAKVLNVVGGMETKRRQYAEGEKFVDHVVGAAGISGLNRAFERADHLPRGEEIADPDAWMTRVGAGPAAGLPAG
jgi:coenzyme F420 biosynthesis associated uncharacterized protein